MLAAESGRRVRPSDESDASDLTSLYHALMLQINSDKRRKPKALVVPPGQRQLVEGPTKEDDALRPEDVRVLHKVLVDNGLYAPSTPGEPRDPQRDVAIDMTIQLLVRNSRSGRVKLVEQPAAEELHAEFWNMERNQGGMVSFKNPQRVASKIRIIAAYTGGVVVAGATVAWSYYLPVVLEKIKSKVLRSILQSTAYVNVFDVLFVTADVIKTGTDPEATYNELAMKVAKGAVKLARPILMQGVSQGTKVLLGGLMLSPAGAIVGTLVISATAIAAGVLLNAVIERIGLKEESVEQVVAETITAEEFNKREYEDLSRELRWQRKFRLGGVVSKSVAALRGVGPKYWLATAAVVAEVYNPMSFALLDNIVDSIAINSILMPQAMRLLGNVIGSDKFQRALWAPASAAFSALRRYEHFDRVAAWMERHYAFLTIEKILRELFLMNLSMYLRMGLNTASIREQVALSFAKWGEPEGQADVPDVSRVVEDATSAAEQQDALDRLQMEATMRSTAGGFQPAEMQELLGRAADAEALFQARSMVSKVVEARTPTYKANVAAYTKAKNEYGVLAKNDAVWNLWNLNEKSFDDFKGSLGSASTMSNMAAMMGRTGRGSIVWKDVAAWRSAQGWVSRAYLSRLARPSPNDLKVASAKLLSAETNLRNDLAAEAYILISDFAHFAERLRGLSTMIAPWPRGLLRDLTALFDKFTHNIPPGQEGDYRALLKFSDKSKTYDDLNASPPGDSAAVHKSIFAALNVKDVDSKTFAAWQSSVTAEMRAEWRRASGTPDNHEKEINAVLFGPRNKPPPPTTRAPTPMEQWTAEFRPYVSAEVITRNAADPSAQKPKSGGDAAVSDFLKATAINGFLSSMANSLRSTLDVQAALGSTFTMGNVLVNGQAFAASQISLEQTAPGEPMAPEQSGFERFFEQNTPKPMPEICGQYTGGTTTMGINPEPPHDTIPFYNGQPINPLCYQNAPGAVLRRMFNTMTLDLNPSEISAAGIMAIMPALSGGATALGPAHAAMQTFHGVHASLELLKANKAIMECPGGLLYADFDSIQDPAQRASAIKCHIANDLLHRTCLTSGAVPFQQYLLPGDLNPCRHVNAYVTPSDWLKAMPALVKIFGESIKGGAKIAQMEPIRGAAALISNMYSFMTQGWTNKDPAMREALYTLEYGSAGAGTWRDSMKVLNSLSKDERGRMQNLFDSEFRGSYQEFYSLLGGAVAGGAKLAGWLARKTAGAAVSGIGRAGAAVLGAPV